MMYPFKFPKVFKVPMRRTKCPAVAQVDRAFEGTENDA